MWHEISTAPSKAQCRIGVINQALLRVRTDKKKISDSFFKMLFRSPYFQAQIFANSTGMAIPNVKGVKELKAIPVPLPPLAEQHRVVAKVDELMRLCDRLEASLTTADDNRRRLLDALLAEALVPTERELAAAE
jgi:type I restriction enzyme, S subunit